MATESLLMFILGAGVLCLIGGFWLEESGGFTFFKAEPPLGINYSEDRSG
jgi:hypothetical protein